MTAVSAEIMRDLAPTGTLRAAINFGNGVLAQRDPHTGEPRGVSVDLARALADELGVPIAFALFEGAGKVFEALSNDKTEEQWDVAFLAVDPVRAAEIAFTAPYILIEGTYLVRADAPYRSVDDLDRLGSRIAVGKGAAYDLYLTRHLKHAKLIREADGGSRSMIDTFLRDGLEAAAGVRQSLDEYAATDSAVRVLDEAFMHIRQAMGTPRERTQGFNYIRQFIERKKATDFIRDGLRRSGQTASLAPEE